MAAWGYELVSSRAESISHSFASLTRALEDKIRIPKRPCNILYFCNFLFRLSLQNFEILRIKFLVEKLLEIDLSKRCKFIQY